MQFLAGTFRSVVAAHPPPAGGASPPSPFNPSDAIHSAAMYLCDNGARDNRDLRAAIFTYNRAGWYVEKVLATAADYAAAAPTPPGEAAVAAIGYAMTQLGQPYVWGGDGPEAGEAGFDCSGLMKAAYATAGVQLPRVAVDQHRAGPAVPAGEALQPGDLVFFANPRQGVHHVALYLGDGQIIHAPRRGDVIRVANLTDIAGYLGATRPAHTPPTATAGRAPPR